MLATTKHSPSCTAMIVGNCSSETKSVTIHGLLCLHYLAYRWNEKFMDIWFLRSCEVRTLLLQTCPSTWTTSVLCSLRLKFLTFLEHWCAQSRNPFSDIGVNVAEHGQRLSLRLWETRCLCSHFHTACFFLIILILIQSWGQTWTSNIKRSVAI